MGEQFRVVFLGGGDAASMNEVRQRMARLFKVPEERIEQLFVRAPIVVKSGVGLELAEKMVAAIEGCGGRARFEPMPEAAAQAAGAQPSGGATMICPSCSQEQPRADTCIFCGKVIAKVQEALRRQQEEEQRVERRKKPRHFQELNLRPMSIGDMLGASFAMLREHLPVFAGIAVLVPTALLLLVVAVFGGVFYAYVRGHDLNLQMLMVSMMSGQELPFSPLVLGVLFLLGWACAMVVMLWEQAALTYAVSERHLGHKIAIFDSYRFALKRIAPLSWTGFTTGLIIIGAVVVTMLPGMLLGPLAMLGTVLVTFYLVMRYILVEKIVVLEGLSGGEARARSQQLISGNALRLIGMLLAFGLVAGLIKFGLSLFEPLLEGMPLAMQTTGQLALGVLSTTFGTALPSMGLCLFYYDARLRHDGALTYEDIAKGLE